MTCIKDGNGRQDAHHAAGWGIDYGRPAVQEQAADLGTWSDAIEAAGDLAIRAGEGAIVVYATIAALLGALVYFGTP